MKEKFGITTKGVGDSTAERILLNTDKMLENVIWCYKDWYTENPYQHFQGKELKDVPWHLMANEQFQMLRMLEKKDVIDNLYSYSERNGVCLLKQ
jgi:hypothetical protein